MKKKERKEGRKKRKAHNGRRWSPSVRMHISVLCIQTGNGRPIFWTRETKEKEGGREIRGRFLPDEEAS